MDLALPLRPASPSVLPPRLDRRPGIAEAKEGEKDPVPTMQVRYQGPTTAQLLNRACPCNFEDSG